MKFIYIAILFLLFSCGVKITSEQQEHLDELKITYDSLIVGFEKIDSSQITFLISDYTKKREFFSKEMKDTLGEDQMLLIDEFMGLNKHLDYLENGYEILGDEIKTTAEQLNLMQTDIDNRLIDQKQFTKYIEVEYENMNALEGEIGRYFGTYNGFAIYYEENIAKIESIIKAYQDQKGI